MIKYSVFLSKSNYLILGFFLFLIINYGMSTVILHPISDDIYHYINITKPIPDETHQYINIIKHSVILILCISKIFKKLR